MKTLILAGAFALSSVATQATPTRTSAETKTISYQATQNLYAMYGHLENVTWRQSINNMIRADFVFEEESYAVFFSDQGEFLAETKKVTLSDLPLALRKTANQKFEGVTLTESLELFNADEHAWFFKTEFEGKTKIWKGYYNGSIELYYQK
jgi:hypothetical protein